MLKKQQAQECSHEKLDSPFTLLSADIVYMDKR